MVEGTGGRYAANPPGITEILRSKRVFVAGCGGLGSNVAVCLARAGVGFIALADFDRVELSNLNRQHFFVDQVGLPKAEALRLNLARINPEVHVSAAVVKLTRENLADQLPTACDVVFECFDRAEAKAMLVEFCLERLPDVPVIAVSGLAGVGPVDELRVSRGPLNLYLVGDGVSEMNAGNGTLSTRVVAAAAIQAHTAIRLLAGL